MASNPHGEFGAHFATRIAAAERDERRSQRRALVILLVSLALGVGLIVYALEEVARTQPAKVVIDPAKLPSIRPGPSR